MAGQLSLIEENANKLVGDFILQDERAWDEEVVLNNFTATEAHKILATPIEKSYFDDIII